MKFLTLSPIQTLPYFSSATKKRITEANQAIEAVEDSRQRFRQHLAEIQAADIETADFGNLVGINVPKQMAAECLQEELAARQRIAATLELIPGEFSAERQRLERELAKVRNQVKEGLIAVGYFPPDHPDALGRIVPAWIERHPKVRTIATEEKSLADRCLSGAGVKQNQEAMVQLRETLTKLRDAAAKV